MAPFGDYEEVKDRIPRFWEKHPDGSIFTEIVHRSDTEYIVRAELRERHRLIATGFAQEVVGSSKVNETSALENCETSAIGRALANAGFAGHGKPRPSREEMEGTQRQPSGGVRAATDKQRKMLQTLVDRTGHIPPVWPLPDDLSMRQASAWIDALQAEPKEPRAERRASMRENSGAVENPVGGDADSPAPETLGPGDRGAAEPEPGGPGDASTREGSSVGRRDDVGSSPGPVGYMSWTREALADECGRLELPHSGNKDRLVAELRAYDALNPEHGEHYDVHAQDRPF